MVVTVAEHSRIGSQAIGQILEFAFQSVRFNLQVTIGLKVVATKEIELL